MFVKNKYVYLEVLRIISIFCVVFNHTGNNGWLYYTQSTGWLSAVFLFLSVFCKISVPAFLMISGAVLLDKEEDLKTILLKRILRACLLILFVSLIHYFYIGYMNSYQLSIKHFFETMLYTYNLCSYYLWMYLGLMIGLPFLRHIAKQMTGSQFIYLISIYIIYGILGTMLNFNFVNIISYLYLLNGVFLFPLYGYFIHKKADEYDYKKILIIGGLISLALLILNILKNYQYFLDTGTHTEIYSWCGTILAMYIFYVVKYVCKTLENKKWFIAITPTIIKLGSLVFGVFIFSDIILWHIVDFYNILNKVLPWNLACHLWILVTVLISAVITAILKFICPPIKKLI